MTALYNGDHQRIDYGKLASYVADSMRSGSLQKVYYYTAIGDSNGDKVANTKKFVDTLNKHVPYCVAKTGYLRANGSGGYDEKGTDVHIAVDLVSLAFTNAYDEAILFSADTDYEPAIRQAQNLGKNVVCGIVDQQKAGYMKELCDDYFIVKQEELNKLMR